MLSWPHVFWRSLDMFRVFPALFCELAQPLNTSRSERILISQSHGSRRGVWDELIWMVDGRFAETALGCMNLFAAPWAIIIFQIDLWHGQLDSKWFFFAIHLQPVPCLHGCTTGDNEPGILDTLVTRGTSWHLYRSGGPAVLFFSPKNRQKRALKINRKLVVVLSAVFGG